MKRYFQTFKKHRFRPPAIWANYPENVFLHIALSANALDTTYQPMARKLRELENFFNATALVDLLALSWSGFYKLRKRGIIGPPDALLSGRPIWLRQRLKEIENRIQEHESRFKQICQKTSRRTKP